MSPRRPTLDELLALPQSVQRLVHVAELRQHPGRRADHLRKEHSDIPRPEHRDLVLDQCARLRPVPLEEVERARGAVGHADGERMLCRLGETDRLSLVLGGLGESVRAGRGSEPTRRRS